MPLEPEMTLRDVAAAELILPKNRHPEEDAARAWLPGDGSAEDHPFNMLFEHVAPSHGEIERRLAQAREGHRIAEEFPERGAYHGGPPTEDMGGITMPADPRKLIGPFVPVPPSEVPPPQTGGTKMKVQSWDEYMGEQRALREGTQGSTPAQGPSLGTGAPMGSVRGFPVIRGD